MSDQIRALERRVAELEARLLSEARTLSDEAKSVAAEARVLADEARGQSELRRTDGEDLARRLREQESINRELRTRLSALERRSTDG